jgi:hypothetical protein
MENIKSKFYNVEDNRAKICEYHKQLFNIDDNCLIKLKTNDDLFLCDYHNCLEDASYEITFK